MTTKKIPTILRKPWHRKTDWWQATDANGLCCSFQHKPYLYPAEHVWMNSRFCSVIKHHGPMPADYTTTLRRIIDRKKGSK